MKKRLLAITIMLSMILSVACSAKNNIASDNNNSDTESQTPTESNTTEKLSEEDTDLEENSSKFESSFDTSNEATETNTEIIEDSSHDESEGEENTQTESTDEQSTNAETTEYIPQVVIPEDAAPDVTHLINDDISYKKIGLDFANISLSSVIDTGNFLSTGGTLFTSGNEGMTTVNSNWDALGLICPISDENYTLSTSFTVHKNDRSGDTNSGMVGIFCKSARNLFIDGGLWFMFRDSRVIAYIDGEMSFSLIRKLPFDAADGVDFKAVYSGDGLEIYANEIQIATVTYSDTAITVTSADGKSMSASLDNVSVDGTGFFRYMSHYANTTLKSMYYEGQSVDEYTISDKVFSVCAKESYGFADKAQILGSVNSEIYNGVCFADARLLCSMFDMGYSVSDDTLTVTYKNIVLKFVSGKAEVDLCGETYPFPTVINKDGCFMLSAEHFASMLGYSAVNDGDLTVMAKKSLLEDNAVSYAADRFELYREVIYNYDDVSCSKVGVGRYNETPYDQRLVGIAYTTWHRASSSWGEGHTWDTPLYGTYYSNDEDVIRRHGEMLRDAGVDFVFVDWSNNTGYNPDTMSHLDDFRMIEEATDMLFDIWATIEGAPKICIFVGPGHNGIQSVESGDHQRKVNQVWNNYVTNPNRADMYFYYNEKPLLICYGATPNDYTATPQNLWNDSRYTVRWMTGYVGQQSDLYDKATLRSYSFWSWEERGAQTYTVFRKRVEAVTVSAATRPQSSIGDEGYIPEAGRNNGATLKAQFQRACDLGAGLVLIVSWNEWTTGEQPSAEISKDIEPSVIHGTFYYDLMREQIKKFKGLVP